MICCLQMSVHDVLCLQMSVHDVLCLQMSVHDVLCLQMSVHGWNVTITLRPGPFRSGATTSSRHSE